MLRGVKYTIKAVHNTGTSIHQEEILHLSINQAFQQFEIMQRSFCSVSMINEETGKVEFTTSMSYPMWKMIYKKNNQ